MRKNGTLNYLISDHLGSTSIVTDASGNIVNQTQYKAWGEERYSSGTKQTNYGYTGQYSYESDFGLMFYNARWYDSYLNRFTQPDSIVPDPYNPQDYDRYSYVRNNPLRYTDPSGHKECDYKCQIKYEGADPFYEHYGEGLDCYGPEDCYGIKPNSIVSRALRGNDGAMINAITPTDYGLRIQGEVVTKNLLPWWMPSSGTIGFQETFNRNDGNLVLSGDWSLEIGPTLSPQFPVGISVTEGGVLGWFSSDVKQSTSGDSIIISGTVAGRQAVSASVTTPANLQPDRKYGVAPFTIYGGRGYGGGYASQGEGIVHSIPIATVNIYQLFGFKP